jgi:hypothetical protein
MISGPWTRSGSKQSFLRERDKAALTRDLPDRIGEVKQRMHGGCCYAVGSLVVNRGGGEFIRERFTG